jgi:alpha-2-macroglobulin
VREYTNASGQVVTAAKLGEELDVHVKIRATEADSVGSVAIVDLLPGGFEPVLTPPPAPEPAAEGEETPAEQPAWRSPIGTPASTWALEYADVRDDRVVIYGTALRNVEEFVYKIRATNAGTFVVPPAYGESLYDRNVQARSLGAKIEVTKK